MHVRSTYAMTFVPPIFRRLVLLLLRFLVMFALCLMIYVSCISLYRLLTSPHSQRAISRPAKSLQNVSSPTASPTISLVELGIKATPTAIHVKTRHQTRKNKTGKIHRTFFKRKNQLRKLLTAPNRNGSSIERTPSRVSLNRTGNMFGAAFEEISPDEYLAMNQSYFVGRRHGVVKSQVPEWLVQTPRCSAPGPLLLVMIPSMDNHEDQRKAVRETWASPIYGHSWPGYSLSDSIKLVFFLGVSSPNGQKNAVQESKLYKDIVRGNFWDTYENLSLKMIAVLQWVAAHCPSARHVLKVDEDTFVNLPLLVNVLKQLSANASRFVLGHKHYYEQPPVLRNGRWRVSNEIYPFPYYPRYLYGHSYIISGDAIKPLLRASQQMPLIPNEDAYLTGVLTKTANILRLHNQGFAKPVKFGKVPNRCPLVNGTHISQSEFRVQALYKMWDMFRSGRCYSAYF